MHSAHTPRGDKIIRWMICRLFRDQNQVVDMNKAFLELTLNISLRMIAGKRYYGDNVSYTTYHELNLKDGGEIVRVPIEEGQFHAGLIEEQRRALESDCCGERKRNKIQVLLSLQETGPE
ncbi:hypothetical protein SADUNF_Sadunf02G0102200 [Salix dunnii]|uniref:Uncharacterized protein n=1 Tax=Salix dunnii TaxID=1413687 RepID=A0A835N756_9ROSI|nr:hypothetical protein SADUNF_Sadunf02G0102200 [Salix dunnii]